MSPLEKLAIQMANNWHEQQRLIKVLTEEPLTETSKTFTELRLENLCLLMDNQKEAVFKNFKLD